MKKELTASDYKTILALIARANITGQEATPVALLQQKIGGLIALEEMPPLPKGNGKPEVEEKQND